MKRLVLLCLLALSANAHAWRETGHYAICEVAYRHLDAQAKSKVDRILGGRDFATQCTWPDFVRKSREWMHTNNWHFASFDHEEHYFDKNTLDPQGDVIQALMLTEAKLTHPQNADEARHSLRFLAHFIGDIHQPVHIGYRSDTGGNRVNLPWFQPGSRELTNTLDYAENLRADDASASCNGQGEQWLADLNECVHSDISNKPVNLHKIWDQHLLEEYIQQAGLQKEAGDSEFYHRAYATRLDTDWDTIQHSQLLYASYAEMARESRVAVEKAYQTLKLPPDAYYHAQIDRLNERLRLAGYRLAYHLNRLLGEGENEPLRERFRQLQTEELDQHLRQVSDFPRQ